MGLGKLDISLENRPRNRGGVFHGGDKLMGVVRIMINGNPERIRDVKMCYKGQCETHITRLESTGQLPPNPQHKMANYRSTEVYLNHNTYLCGGPGSEFELEPGYFEYPFQLTLPLNLPPSFEGSHGKVRYMIKASIKRRGKIDHETVRTFRVSNVIDLNLESQRYFQPFLGERHKTLCCLWCMSGPISATLKLSRTAFVPGETISILAEADNKSGRKVRSSSIKLFQRVKYIAEGRSQVDTSCLAKISKGSIEPGDSEVWNDRFRLPAAMPPSGMRGCRYIDVSYYLRFEVDPGLMAFDLDIDVPLLIGTVPLRANPSDRALMGSVHPYRPYRGMAVSPPPDYRYIQPPTTCPDIPPPSYGTLLRQGRI